MIEPSSARYFREVAHSGSLTAASENLGVAMSAIGRQIRMLEDYFGTKLFTREARGMRLNPAGVLLLEFLDKQSRDAQEFYSRFEEHLDTPRGLLRIVTIEGVLSQLLPNFMHAFRLANPKVNVSLEVVGSNAAADMVAEEKADLGLLFGPPPRGDLIELAFMSQPLCVVVAPENDLAQKKVCSLDEVVGQRIVLPNKTFGIRQQIDRVQAQKSVRLEISVETNSIGLMRDLAAQGDGVTFLPRHSVLKEVQAGVLVAIPLSEKRLSKTKVTLVRSAMAPLSLPSQRAVALFRSNMAPKGTG